MFWSCMQLYFTAIAKIEVLWMPPDTKLRMLALLEADSNATEIIILMHTNDGGQ